MLNGTEWYLVVSDVGPPGDICYRPFCVFMHGVIEETWNRFVIDSRSFFGR